MPFPHPESVVRRLWRPRMQETGAQIYAIVDAARNDRIYRTIVGADCDYFCLYRGEIAPELAAAAPYLVHLQPQAALTTTLIEQGWGDSWGIFLESAASLNDLRRHFRRFLMVYTDAGKPLYFRYYDPRVLRVYLPTCNPDELQTLFGPVQRYCLEDEESQSLIEFSCADGELQQRTMRLRG